MFPFFVRVIAPDNSSGFQILLQNCRFLSWHQSTLVWPQTLSLFFFSFFFLLFFYLRGHNTCIACRIFVYFSPLARKKVFVQP